MSEDRERVQQGNDEVETEEVEAHKLAAANEEPDSGDDEVEAHRFNA